MGTLNLIEAEHKALLCALRDLYGYTRTSTITSIMGKPTADLRHIDTVSIWNTHGKCMLRLRRLEGCMDLWYRTK